MELRFAQYNLSWGDILNPSEGSQGWQKETNCNLLEEFRSKTKEFITNKILHNY